MEKRKGFNDASVSLIIIAMLREWRFDSADKKIAEGCNMFGKEVFSSSEQRERERRTFLHLPGMD